MNVKLNVIQPSVYDPKFLKWPFTQGYWGNKPFGIFWSLLYAPGGIFNETNFNDTQGNKIFPSALKDTNGEARNEKFRSLEKILYDRGGHVIHTFRQTVDAYNTKFTGLHAGQVHGLEPRPVPLQGGLTSRRRRDRIDRVSIESPSRPDVSGSPRRTATGRGRADRLARLGARLSRDSAAPGRRRPGAAGPRGDSRGPRAPAQAASSRRPGPRPVLALAERHGHRRTGDSRSPRRAPSPISC